MRLLSMAGLFLVSSACGRIYPSRDEIIEQVHARFDLDGSGVIDRREYEVFGSREGGALAFEDIDTDSDGGITPAELDAMNREREPRPLVSRNRSRDDNEGAQVEFYARAPRPGRLP